MQNHLTEWYCDNQNDTESPQWGTMEHLGWETATQVCMNVTPGATPFYLSDQQWNTEDPTEPCESISGTPEIIGSQTWERVCIISGGLLLFTEVALCFPRFLTTMHWCGLASSELFQCCLLERLHVVFGFPLPLSKVALGHFGAYKGNLLRCLCIISGVPLQLTSMALFHVRCPTASHLNGFVGFWESHLCLPGWLCIFWCVPLMLTMVAQFCLRCFTATHCGGSASSWVFCCWLLGSPCKVTNCLKWFKYHSKNMTPDMVEKK